MNRKENILEVDFISAAAKETKDIKAAITEIIPEGGNMEKAFSDVLERLRQKKFNDELIKKSFWEWITLACEKNKTSSVWARIKNGGK
jgi:hypothetical protein